MSTVTTAYHATPAPCDLCATVAPLFRTAGDWVCASCHGMTSAAAYRTARQFPRVPCVDCDPAEHTAYRAAAVARHADIVGAPRLASCPDGLPECDACTPELIR